MLTGVCEYQSLFRWQVFHTMLSLGKFVRHNIKGKILTPSNWTSSGLLLLTEKDKEGFITNCVIKIWD